MIVISKKSGTGWKLKLSTSVLVGVVAAACSSGPKPEPVVTGAGPKAGSTVPLPVGAGKDGESGGASVTGASIQKYANLSEALRGSKTLNVQDEAARILVANPEDVVALNALAMWNYRQKKIGAAKLLLARAIEKGQPNASIHNNYGLMLLSEGDELAAAEHFKKALRLDEGHAEANANLGSHYAKGGDWKKALPRLERAWTAGRQDSSIANNYALSLKGEGDHEKARQVFEDAAKRNNKDPILLLNYASLLIETMNRPKEGLPLVYRVKFLETERKDVLNRANVLERKASGTSTP
jgi:Flp pilus assembly protein TadD